MQLPNFLIIGAMKCGTTTVWADLAQHPDVFMPSNKEPSGLYWCKSSQGTRRYARLFRGARGATAIGEASTDYSKLPSTEGTAALALDVLGPDVQIIYMVRNPLDRVVSHYRHEFSHGRESRPINTAVVETSAYVDYSRYAWQLEPWKTAFGSNVHTIHFERYVDDRVAGLARLAGILGIDPLAFPEPEPAGRNRSDDRAIPRRAVRGPVRSGLYRNWIHPHVPERVRARLKSVLASPPPPAPEATLEPHTAEHLLNQLSEADRLVWQTSD